MKKETPYFESSIKRANLHAELESWLGTPWRHRVAVKGVGADCIHFVAGVFHNLGIIDFGSINVPDYPPDWHLHNTRELLLEEMDKHFKTKLIEIPRVEDGDVILSHYGKAASHASIYFEDFLYHCIRPGGVIKASFFDRAWRDRMRWALRILS